MYEHMYVPLEILKAHSGVFGNSWNTARHDSTASFFTYIENTMYTGSLMTKENTNLITSTTVTLENVT